MYVEPAAWLALTTAADVTIATCIIVGLLKSKSGYVLFLRLMVCPDTDIAAGRTPTN